MGGGGSRGGGGVDRRAAKIKNINIAGGLLLQWCRAFCEIEIITRKQFV